MIWLPFQECTGCTESITRAHGADAREPDLRGDLARLPAHAAGGRGRRGRARPHAGHEGQLGQVPADRRRLDPDRQSRLRHHRGPRQPEHARRRRPRAPRPSSRSAPARPTAGIPGAAPNPTGAVPVGDVIKDKPIVNVPGCPPIPVVITGVLVQYLTFGKLPELDALGRPTVVLRPDDPRPLLPPPVLRARPVRRELRRRRRAGRLVPVQARLQGAHHLQRLRHGQVEQRHEFPHRGRARLHRLLANPASGTRAASTSRCPSATGATPRTVGTAVAIGAALGVASAALARRRQRDAEEAAQ